MFATLAQRRPSWLVFGGGCSVVGHSNPFCPTTSSWTSHSQSNQSRYANRAHQTAAALVGLEADVFRRNATLQGSGLLQDLAHMMITGVVETGTPWPK